MKKNIYFLFFILIFIIGCKQNEVIKTHGIAYLEKREKLIVVNESNKNDIIAVLGQPATKGMLMIICGYILKELSPKANY